VDPRRLRQPEEAFRRGAGDNRANGDGTPSEQAAGPNWERRPVRPVVDARVAVYGVCQARLCRLVADMMVEGEFSSLRLGCHCREHSPCCLVYSLFVPPFSGLILVGPEVTKARKKVCLNFSSQLLCVAGANLVRFRPVKFE